MGLIACHLQHHLPLQLAIPKMLIGSHVMMSPASLIKLGKVGGSLAIGGGEGRRGGKKGLNKEY